MENLNGARGNDDSLGDDTISWVDGRPDLGSERDAFIPGGRRVRPGVVCQDYSLSHLKVSLERGHNGQREDHYRRGYLSPLSHFHS